MYRIYWGIAAKRLVMPGVVIHINLIVSPFFIIATAIFTPDPVNKEHYKENDFHLTSEPNNTNEQE